MAPRIAEVKELSLGWSAGTKLEWKEIGDAADSCSQKLEEKMAKLGKDLVLTNNFFHLPQKPPAWVRKLKKQSSLDQRS